MIRTQIYLTEQEHKLLHNLSRRRDASVSALIRGAIDQMLPRSQRADRLDLMRQARGIWKTRDDLPDFSRLRRELGHSRKYYSAASVLADLDHRLQKPEAKSKPAQ